MGTYETYGIMAVDHEIRIDYNKLRKERLEKTREQMKKDNVGALLAFDCDHIRYITSTKIGEWNVEIRPRYCLLPVNGDPILFEVGSAIPRKKMLCPWLKDIRPSKTDFQGIEPAGFNSWDKCADEITLILKDYGLENEPLGVDIPTVNLIRSFEKRGINIIDGRITLLDAQTIKTKEEIQLLEISASMVDAAFWDVVNFVHPGVKENEIAALIRDRLLKLGAENVLNAQVTTGNRTNPHPHDVSDRIVGVGDMIFIDVVNNFNGYKTCYYRTFVCGEPTEKQKRIYKQAYDYVYSAIEKIKPGVSTAEIAKCWPDDADLLQLAHGVGITHWAKPLITKLHSFEKPEVIKENMHIAVENYYAEGIDGARIEEQVVVTKDGCRTITKFPCDKLISCW